MQVLFVTFLLQNKKPPNRTKGGFLCKSTLVEMNSPIHHIAIGIGNQGYFFFTFVPLD
jgi:hypothetical protein